MTLSMMVECCYAVSFVLPVVYAECHKLVHYAECHYAECHYGECYYTQCRGASSEPCSSIVDKGGSDRQ